MADLTYMGWWIRNTEAAKRRLEKMRPWNIGEPIIEESAFGEKTEVWHPTLIQTVSVDGDEAVLHYPGLEGIRDKWTVRTEDLADREKYLPVKWVPLGPEDAEEVIGRLVTTTVLGEQTTLRELVTRTLAAGPKLKINGANADMFLIAGSEIDGFPVGKPTL